MRRLRQRLSHHRGHHLDGDAHANKESKTTTPQSKSAEFAKPNEETSNPPTASGSRTIEVHPFGSTSNETNSATSATQSATLSTASVFGENRGGSGSAHPRPAGPSKKGISFTIDRLDGVMNFSEMMEFLGNDFRRVREGIITERGSVTCYELLDSLKTRFA